MLAAALFGNDSRACDELASTRSLTAGQRYLIVVVDHDTGNLVWAAPGRDSKTLRHLRSPG